MNKAFEKILERFDAKKQYFQKFYEADGKTEEDKYINKATQLAFDDAKNIVQKVAEEYKDKYVSKDEVGYMLDSIEMRGDETWMDYYRKALKCLCKLTDKEYNGGWISVKDRLPDKAGSYLVIGKSGGATVTRWYMPSEFYPEGHFGGNSSDYIRYWMPRPEPPKERD